MIDVDNVHAIYNRGICYERLRDFNKVNDYPIFFKAIFDFSRVIQLQSD